MGTGIGRGFQSGFDAAWLVKQFEIVKRVGKHVENKSEFYSEIDSEIDCGNLSKTVLLDSFICFYSEK